MDTDTVGPALTPDEWASELADYGDGSPQIFSANMARAMGPRSRHFQAALCLHGQPFGFTWEDVNALRESCDDLPIDHGSHPHEARLRDLADRIAALLTPREP